MIGKASPTVATSLSASTITVGGSVHDTATLSGATSGAGGSVTYSYFTNNTCTTGAVSLTPVTVTNHVVPPSSTVLFTSTGTYYWQAVYTGDGSNNGAHSACTSEQLAVNKAAPSISTSASGPVTIGGSITDTATLTGAYGTPVKGTVTFNLYAASDNDADDTGNDNAQGNEDGNNQGSDNGDDNDSCKTPLNSTPIATLTTGTSGGNPTYTSAPFTPTKAGTYVWVATFAGDTYNNPVSESCGGANETTTVNKAQPSLSTSATGSVTVGGTVSDTATLSGLVSPDGSGAVVFGLFSNSHCTGLPIFVSSSGGVSGNGGYGSGNYTTTTANPSGDYWAALYTGDSNNNPVVESCGGAHETTLVSKATPSISTTPSAGVAIGGKVFDAATITNGYQVNGQNITFTLYKDSVCSSSVFSSTNGISAGGATSGSYTTTAAGTFYWRASYAGDGNNNAVTTPCGAETVVVTSSTLPVTVTGNAGPLYPLPANGTATPIPVTFTNPNGVAETVTSLTITATGLPAGCVPDLVISYGAHPVSASNPLTVPPGPLTLPTASVSEPMILMVDNGANDVACAGKSFTLSYGGTYTGVGTVTFGSPTVYTVVIGTATGGLLTPTVIGDPNATVDVVPVTVTNNDPADEYLGSLQLEVNGTNKAGCIASDFSINGAGTSATVHPSVTLLPLADSPSNTYNTTNTGPHPTFTIQMVENHVPQNACIGAHVSLTALAS